VVQSIYAEIAIRLASFIDNDWCAGRKHIPRAEGLERRPKRAEWVPDATWLKYGAKFAELIAY
jgi:hypothetical protein